MATTRPFAFNTGSTISGTEQIGNLAIGENNRDYSGDYGGVRWWMGPDEDLGYVVGGTRPSNDQPTQPGIVPPFGSVGFWRTNGFSDSSFINLSEYISVKNGTPQTFNSASDAKVWLNNNGYWTSYVSIVVSPTPTSTVTPTPSSTQILPTPTPTSTVTPTPSSTQILPTPTQTPTNTSTPTPTNTSTPTPTNTSTQTPTNTPTPTNNVQLLIDPILAGNDEYIEVGLDEFLMFVDPVVPGVTPTTTPTPTQTPSNTPTQTPTSTTTQTPTQTPSNTPSNTPSVTPSITSSNTPTPSVTPSPVTGYSFNLVELPYNFPSSGNSIMNNTGGINTGSTEINLLTTNGRGFYFNSIDVDGINRNNHYLAYTGQNVTVTFTQGASTAIYSGDTNSFKNWISGSDTGFVFGTGVGVPPSGTPSGTAILTQSASTQFIIGLPVLVSVQPVNPVTPTQTPTPSITPSVTPSSGATPAGFVVTIQEVGPDVVWSGSGTINLNDLTLQNTQNISSGLDASQAIWAAGSTTPTPSELWSGPSFTVYPTSFGSPGGSAPSSATGSVFGILTGGSGRTVVVPSGYVSGSVLNGTTTYANTTISAMGLTLGTYVWSWGSGSNQGSITMIIG